jgi:hypothetical protein
VVRGDFTLKAMKKVAIKRNVVSQQRAVLTKCGNKHLLGVESIPSISEGHLTPDMKLNYFTTAKVISEKVVVIRIKYSDFLRF